MSRLQRTVYAWIRHCHKPTHLLGWEVGWNYQDREEDIDALSSRPSYISLLLTWTSQSISCALLAYARVVVDDLQIQTSCSPSTLFGMLLVIIVPPSGKANPWVYAKWVAPVIDKLSWRLFYEAGRLVWQPLILNLSEISYVLSKTAAFNGALLANFKKSLSQMSS